MRALSSMLWLLALLGLAGCPKARIEEALLSYEWEEVCPGGLPEVARLRFEDDGTFQFSYASAGPGWQGDPDEVWVVRRKEVMVSWNGGYAITVYTVDPMPPGERLRGLSSVAACRQTAVLRRGAALAPAGSGRR